MRPARSVFLTIACVLPLAPALATEPSVQGDLRSEPDYSALETVQVLPREYDASPGEDADGPAPLARPLYQRYAPRQQSQGALNQQLGCLAEAIYFEARGEPLEGQLAVGRVVVARARSGRFPSSYCGVVLQPSQFSFVHEGVMPQPNYYSWEWRNAVAIAQIAHAGTRPSPVEGALYYHAARISPGWRRAPIAQVGNHIFYR
jgi:spore germination cell wall hydrolase CwlJ-like protein